jgi:uridine kinase
LPGEIVTGFEIARMKKRIVMIAGPDGAGKTTFAREFLPNEFDCPHFGAS